MLAVAAGFPEWRDRASRVQLVEVAANDYYGNGYQDMMNRRPAIDTTCADLQWQPRIGIEESLKRLFAHYRSEIGNSSAFAADTSGGDTPARELARTSSA
jgi:nucleoside-diphosphate-sugar epimerase